MELKKSTPLDHSENSSETFSLQATSLLPSLIGKEKTEHYSDNLTLTQIKNMKFPGVTNKTIMEVVNNYGLFTEKYDKVIYSAIDFISKGSYVQIQSDCNRIAIGLKSDSFPTHTRDDKDIKIKI